MSRGSGSEGSEASLEGAGLNQGFPVAARDFLNQAAGFWKG